jgi:hypothetical protein
MGLSPIAKITSAERIAASSSEISGIRTTSAHFGGHHQAQFFFVRLGR